MGQVAATRPVSGAGRLGVVPRRIVWLDDRSRSTLSAEAWAHALGEAHAVPVSALRCTSAGEPSLRGFGELDLLVVGEPCQFLG